MHGDVPFFRPGRAVHNADPHKGPGALRVYSGTAIQCTRVLNSAFQLSLRSTQGFVSSLLELLRSQGASMTSGV